MSPSGSACEGTKALKWWETVSMPGKVTNPYDDPILLGTPLLTLKPEAAAAGYAARWPVEGLPQTGKSILSGGMDTHYVHHLTAMQRLPVLSLVFGSLLKYVAATLPLFGQAFGIASGSQLTDDSYGT